MGISISNLDAFVEKRDSSALNVHLQLERADAVPDVAPDNREDNDDDRKGSTGEVANQLADEGCCWRPN